MRATRLTQWGWYGCTRPMSAAVPSLVHVPELRMLYNPARKPSQAGLCWDATARTLLPPVNVTLIRERLRHDSRYG